MAIDIKVTHNPYGDGRGCDRITTDLINCGHPESKGQDKKTVSGRALNN